jgi:hypothetical protein
MRSLDTYLIQFAIQILVSGVGGVVLEWSNIIVFVTGD